MEDKNKIICNFCGTQIPAGIPFCPKCHEDVREIQLNTIPKYPIPKGYMIVK